MVDVSLFGCEEYSFEKVLKCIKESIEKLGGMQQFVSPGDNVLIKPNMLTAALPDEAVCTHPHIVKAVLTLVKGARGNAVVGDSPAIGNAHKVALKNGIAEVCNEMHVPLIDFNSPQEVAFLEGEVCKRFVIDKNVLDADVIINLPKLKTHGLTFFTGGVKNLYGCITGKQKAQFHLRMPDHKDFSNMLLDLYCLVKPALTIMDGIVGMEGAGPRNGKPRKIGVILASASGVAVDAVAARIIGVDPLDIPTIEGAVKRNIDITTLEDVKLLGDTIDKFLIKDFQQSSAFGSLRALPKPIVSFFQNHLTAKPVISDNCIGCGICKESCPPQVINIKDKKAFITYKDCIRCYCCQELCPSHAIELKKGNLSKFLFK